mmetsp:Transcript_1889/g.2023  ORF Transcript_1889/g.2023 Transcript_1889/m.2023 type:complete len:292 (-) Transcript_1889:64-939(-)
MITHELAGGLGNQLYQIATTIALAMRTNQSFFFIHSDTLNVGKVRSTYWNTLLKGLKKYTLNKDEANIYREGKIYLIKETSSYYNELSLQSSNNSDLFILSGYFQSYKYFEFEFEEITKLVGFRQQMEKALVMYPTIGNTIQNDKNSISLHFRLGDYKHLSDFHVILTVEYFKNSLEYILKNSNQNQNVLYNVYYFCEDEDIIVVEKMVEALKKIARCNFHRISSSITDWEQLLLMSSCKHNIIANSTFSSWAAFLNMSKNKIVCYPSQWFGKLNKGRTKEMFPKDWIKIN